MIVSSAEVRTLGVPTPQAALHVGEATKPDGAWAGRRFLYLGDAAAFELSFWCGTCQFLFKRLEGANDTVSLDGLQGRLAGPINDVPEDVITEFAQLLPTGDYLPLLIKVKPQLVTPGAAEDYFSEEQVATWGLESFWSLPVYPQTPYYRTFETAVDADSHLYEFVVPMVPPLWNERERVAEYVDALAAGSVPTAVALSTLDVCAPAVDSVATDYYTHWGLTHFLLDGHHKFEAAAQVGKPVQLLALIALEGSLAERADLSRLIATRSRRPASRRP